MKSSKTKVRQSVSASERRPSKADRPATRTRNKPRRTKSLSESQALRFNTSDSTTNNHNNNPSRHGRHVHKGSFHSSYTGAPSERLASAAMDSSDSDSEMDHGDLLMKIVSQRSLNRAPEPPESVGSDFSGHREIDHVELNTPETSNSTRSRDEQIAAATNQNRYNQRGQDAAVERLNGSYSGATGKHSPEFQLVEAALPMDRSRIRLERMGTDEEMANSSGYDSIVDDTSEAVGGRGSVYLKSLEVSRSMKGLMALVGTLLVVIPFAFAVEKNQKNTEAAKQQKANASHADNQTLLEEGIVDLMEETFTETDAPKTILDRILPDETLLAVKNQTSPQFKAYQWLLNDPFVEYYSDWQMEQRMAMATFFYAFNGNRWDQNDPQATNWLTYNSSVCYWMPSSYEICHDNLTVARIYLDDLRGFRGSMPAEIGLLSNLEGIEFKNMKLFNRPLSNLLHPNMAKLTALTSLQCSRCDLDAVLAPSDTPKEGSTIPTYISEYLPNLRSLYLNASHLTGTIPTEIGLMTHLTALRLGSNLLTSAIPSELGNLSLLNLLKLSSNRLEYEMPSVVWEHLTDLMELDVNQNKLTGTIPTAIGGMKSLRFLDLKGGNRFRGTLPSELGLLTQLTVLKLGGNEFEGRLPYELRSLSNLVILGLTDNELWGTIPWLDVISYWSSMRGLFLDQNSFTGDLPSYEIKLLTNLTQLQQVNISSNLLVGTIPSELGVLTALTTLSLAENQFEGAVPSELGQLTDLKVFNATNNSGLIGPIPQEICAAAKFGSVLLQLDWCKGRQNCCGL